MADRNLVVELVASEPDVVSPVAIAWDADGRLFVAEMLDYPSGPTSGRIKLLEDRDGDGRYERATVFADKLSFPNGVLPWKGGVLVTAAPDIWYLKDTDGDGQADERRVVLTGFGEGNQQLRVNGLLWGLDNWIYGANGRSEGDVRWVVDAAARLAAGESPGNKAPAISIRGHDFRFRPDQRQFEAIAGRSQFGLARDDWGNRFVSWNEIPIRHEVLPERYLNRNPHLAATESIAEILAPGETRRVFQISPLTTVFNNEPAGFFNALAGLTLFRGQALGETYQGNAFVGETLRNLVHRRVLLPNGPTFVAQRGELNEEFLASTDPWFHPVNFATGPDGALYVVDFYRQFVEHPGWVPANLRDKVPWRTGAEHGRLWRVRLKNAEAGIGKQKPQLSRASGVDLVRHLEDGNGWWRDTSQRLIVERQDRVTVPALEKLAREATWPVSRLQALYTLEGVAALRAELILRALQDPDPMVRQHAIRLSEPYLSGPTTDATGRSDPRAGGERKSPADELPRSGSDKLREAVLGLAGDADARVRFQLALSLGELPGGPKLGALARLAQRDFTNHWHALAILSSLGQNPWGFLKELLEQGNQWLTGPTPEQARFLDQVAMLVGANHSELESGGFVTLLTRPQPNGNLQARLTLLAGFGEGLARSGQSLPQLVANPPISARGQARSLADLISQAAEIAPSAHAPGSLRIVAMRVLAKADPELAGKMLPELLKPDNPAEVQSAAVRALTGLADARLAGALFADWNMYLLATRRQLLAAALRSPSISEALVDALEQGRVLLLELDPSQRQALQKLPEIKARVEKLVRSSPDREEIVRHYQPSLQLEGERRHGAMLFAKSCLTCHALQGTGARVGPDLAGIASHSKESLLVDILDPSRQVSPDFLNYTLVMSEGNIASGLIVAETARSMTLRRAGEMDETILRSQIKELRADGKSLMPDGLEQGLSPQDLADLLAFLREPEVGLLPKEPLESQ